MQRPLEIFLFKGVGSSVSDDQYNSLMKLVPSIAESVSQREQRVRGSEIHIVLSDGRSMRGLNKRFRGVDRATDVLAFPFEGKMLGEVWLCPSVIEKNAKAYEEPADRELVRVLVHGILHLAGHDHKHSFVGDRSVEEEMFRMQEDIVSDVFD